MTDSAAYPHLFRPLGLGSPTSVIACWDHGLDPSRDAERQGRHEDRRRRTPQRWVDETGVPLRADGDEPTLGVEHVVVCAGQEPRRDLFDALQSQGHHAHLIGGADVAAELDAKRAIAQGSRLAGVL